MPEMVLVYGGAKGGGKSVLGVRWMYLEAEKIIAEFQIPKMEHPIPLGFMGRKRGVDFSDTTLETWYREIPQQAYRENKQAKEIVIRDRVKYLYGGFDNREDLDKFNSGEFARIFIDQPEELSEDEFGKVRGTFRLKINGQALHYKMLLTPNPAQNWIKKRFVKNALGTEQGEFFVQALPGDNPYLPESYVEILRRAYKHRPELLEAYLYGNWDATEGASIIIKDCWVRAARNQTIYQGNVRKVVVVDVARFGDDRTVILYMEEGDVKDGEIYGQKDLNYTSGRAATMANNHKLEDDKPPTIVVDADGLGGGVADNLRAWGFDVYEIHSAGQSSKPNEYVNLRAEMWWETGKAFANNDIQLTYDGEGAEELDLELTIPQYFFNKGKIQVESKDEIKKPERYGKSPDIADAYIYGYEGLKHARIPEKNSTEPGRNRERRGLMAASPMGL